MENKNWFPLEIVYEVKENELKNGIRQLTPGWNLLLLGDGSPTYNLQILTGSPTIINLIGMENTKSSTLSLPPVKIKEITNDYCYQRKVFLENQNKERLGYAVSWWKEEDIIKFFNNENNNVKKPIGENIVTEKKELFRDIIKVFYGYSNDLANAFLEDNIQQVYDNNNNNEDNNNSKKRKGFWGRYYIFYQNGKPLTFIYEVFSSVLCKYLGIYDGNK